MKKLLPFILIFFLLAGCSAFSSQPSDSEMATTVAQILTNYPTNTIDPNLKPSPLPVKPFGTLSPLATKTPVRIYTLVPLVTSTPDLSGTPASSSSGVTTTTTQLPTSVAVFTTSTRTAVPIFMFTPPPGDPVTRLGKPTSTDPMDNATKWNWTIGASPFTDQQFQDGTMVLTALTDKYGWRLASTDSLENFYMDMAGRLEKCSGTDSYGIIFRVPVLKEANRGYLYGFTCDGKYFLKTWDGTVAPNGKMVTLVGPKASSFIQAGPKVFNRMGMMAVGNRLILYANGNLLEEYKDSTFSSGYFGVFINSDSTQNLTLLVDQMSYWLNPAP